MPEGSGGGASSGGEGSLFPKAAASSSRKAGASTQSTCSSVGIGTAIFATFFCRSDSVVTRTLPRPMFTRVAMGSGPKAEKSGETAAPSRSAPSTAK